MRFANKILVTGSAGFIGMHTVLRLLLDGWDVVGLDNLNPYYSVDLKLSRLANTGILDKTFKEGELISSKFSPNYHFVKINLESTASINTLFKKEQFNYVIHLGAQAGVRYSLKNPYAYIKSNVQGFMNIIEACRQNEIAHLVYASSSSVYGLTDRSPFNERQATDTPASLYAATKKSNELIAHSYSHLFKLATTALRFFTVYGPWGRPDMALFLFTDHISKGIPIEVFGNGEMTRDFTYIDDVVDAVVKTILKPPGEHPPYSVFNVGNSRPIRVLNYIQEIENALGKRAIINFRDAHPADVVDTHADIDAIQNHIEYNPQTTLTTGVQNFVKWYQEHYEPLEKSADAVKF